jgi:hypothetical protein
MIYSLRIQRNSAPIPALVDGNIYARRFFDRNLLAYTDLLSVAHNFRRVAKDARGRVTIRGGHPQ